VCLVQDFKTRELVALYQQKVLSAATEVENGIITYLGAQRETASLNASVRDARPAGDIASENFKAGRMDFTPVFVAEQFLAQQENVLAQAEADVAQGLIAVYRALGGGWELRSSDGAACAGPAPAPKAVPPSPGEGASAGSHPR
jgi:outer membrane protein TolC